MPCEGVVIKFTGSTTKKEDSGAFNLSLLQEKKKNKLQNSNKYSKYLCIRDIKRKDSSTYCIDTRKNVFLKNRITFLLD